MNRASTILNELSESLNVDSLDKTFFANVSVSTIQRLGFLLELVPEQSELADKLFAKAKENGCTFQKIPLKTGNKTERYEVDSKWKIIINEEIEIDE